MTRRRITGLALCLMALLALGACAPRIELPRYDEAETDLNAFRARFVEPPLLAHGLAARASLLYTTPGRSNRTDVQIFGEYALPLRLDVRAGFGTMVALMREDAAGLLAFYPDKSRAYAHRDPVIGAQLLGLPFPFALKDLSLVLSGRFGSLIPPVADQVEPRRGGGFAFRYATGPVRLLELDSFGRPLRMQGILSKHFKSQRERDGHEVKGPRIWTITFSAYPEDDGDPVGPATVLTLDLPGGDGAVLRVRSLATRQEPWAAKALGLTLPQGSTFMSLDNQATPPQESAVITGGGANGSADTGPAQHPGN